MLLVFPSTRLTLGLRIACGTLRKLSSTWYETGKCLTSTEGFVAFVLDLSPRTNLVPSASKCCTVPSFRLAFGQELAGGLRHPFQEHTSSQKSNIGKESGITSY